jgi:hypothetical protein
MGEFVAQQPRDRQPADAVEMFTDGREKGLWDDAEECLSKIDDATARLFGVYEPRHARPATTA